MAISIHLALYRTLCSLVIGAVLLLGKAHAQDGNPVPTGVCSAIEGTYMNSGFQVSGNDRGSTAPPLISRDVLRQFKPGVLTNWVAIKLLGGDRLRFSLQDQNGVAIMEYEHAMQCANGEVMFERASIGGSEGFRGTSVTQVKLRTNDSGETLAVSVVFRSQGQDFLIFPRSETSERQFLFRSKQGAYNVPGPN